MSTLIGKRRRKGPGPGVASGTKMFGRPASSRLDRITPHLMMSFVHPFDYALSYTS